MKLFPNVVVVVVSGSGVEINASAGAVTLLVFVFIKTTNTGYGVEGDYNIRKNIDIRFIFPDLFTERFRTSCKKNYQKN